MFERKKWEKIGFVYIFIMYGLHLVLPEWMGRENGVIECMQMVVLVAAWYLCHTHIRGAHALECFNPRRLWQAGCVFFFLIFMREINWGRTLFIKPDGEFYEYSDMGLYGELVHPMVGLLLVVLLVLLWQGSIRRALTTLDFPGRLFGLMLVFIIFTHMGEHMNIAFYHGEVAEELAELGAYSMLYVILHDFARQLKEKYDMN